MPALFDPARHEALSAAPWSEAAARAAIERIADEACAAFDPALGWPAHPLDDPAHPDEHFHDLYCGAGGVIWALEHLADAGAIERRRDFRPCAAGLLARQRAQGAAAPHGTASFLLGEAGLLLLQCKLAADAAAAAASADALFGVVEGNLRNPTREPLWGSSGTVLAAIAMAEHTGQPRWAALVRRAADILCEELEPIAAAGGRPGWVQQAWGRTQVLLGAGHGYVGNVFAIVRGRALLDAALVDGCVARALDLLQATALHDGGAVNWFPDIDGVDSRRGKLLVQDCHGAPGVLCRLSGVPRDGAEGQAWDALLAAAGELTWRAGPLAKGASVCHGTAGSALALLHLWQRTGDGSWLDRARALAMHAIAQSERQRAAHGRGRHALWTGDLGLACVLWACLEGRAGFPTMDLY